MDGDSDFGSDSDSAHSTVSNIRRKRRRQERRERFEETQLEIEQYRTMNKFPDFELDENNSVPESALVSFAKALPDRFTAPCIFQVLEDEFQLDLRTTPSLEDFQGFLATFDRLRGDLTALNTSLYQRALTGLEEDEETEESLELRRCMDQSIVSLRSIREFVGASMKHHRLSHALDLSSEELSIAGIETLDPLPLLSAENPLFRLTQTIIRSVTRNGLKRYVEKSATTSAVNAELWGEIRHNDHWTRAYEKKYTVAEFIYELCDSRTHPENARLLQSSKGMVAEITKYLAGCAELTDIVKDSRYMSFANGIYDLEQHAFVEYGGQTAIPANIVTCNFIEQHCDWEAVQGLGTETDFEQGNWFDVPTPVFDHLLDHQNFDEQTKRAFYMFVGRALYAGKVKEHWQIVPFLHGVAGTGKSTICDAIKTMFNMADVGIISNCIEPQFGLYPLAEKKFVMGEEIAADFQMRQTDFQNIVSNELVQIARKGESSRMVDWTAHMFLAGNELPNFKDHQGQISRRVAMFNFYVPVNTRDTGLGKRLMRELPLRIIKANLAYRACTGSYGYAGSADGSAADAWTFLPKYFHDNKNALSMEKNSLGHFLENGDIELGAQFEEVEKTVKEKFYQHCRENNISTTGVVWCEDLYRTEFHKHHITVSKGPVCRRVNGVRRHCKMVTGLRVRRDDGDMDSGDDL